MGDGWKRAVAATEKVRANNREFSQLLETFRADLAKEHEKRSTRTVEEWQRLEVDFMHARVNLVRAMRGHPPIERAEIEKADRCASGHSDYALKFALYCRDLVYADSFIP